MSTQSAAPSYTPAETQWVDAELVRSLMRVAHSTQFASWVVIPVFLGLMWGTADDWALAGWALACVGIAVARSLMLRHFALHLATAAPQAQLAFFGKYRHVWTASAFIWGGTTALYFDRVGLSIQFLCWLMLAGIAMFAVNGLAGHRPTVRTYVNTLMATTMAIVLWDVVVEERFDGPVYHYWLIALLGIFWQALLEAARRLHLANRRNFELQYRNTQLIDSLTRQTQAALDAVEIKNRFLASATHDIRQPVHALGLYADWLVSEPDLVNELAPKILESTKAVNALFDSLFDLVRLDSGKIRLNLDQVPLDKLLDDLELQYRPLAEAKGLRLRVRPAHGAVLSDALLLRRIVGNLISNAIKYTNQGGVLVGVRHDARGPRIEVWDTGVGIAPMHQREIFREFYKVPAHAGTEDGFGLGLYIVARLSHILGHPVELNSKQGKGSVFRLLLKPADPVQAAARVASMDQVARSP